jgi:predicted metal-dependent hydrolase
MAARKFSLFGISWQSAPAAVTSRRTFVVGGAAIDYTLNRSPRRRRLVLSVDEQGLRVGAPWRASQSRIDELLAANSAWITRKLAQWQARRRQPILWKAGATVMVLGEALMLATTPAKTRTSHNSFYLDVGDAADDAAVIEQRVIDWLRSTAQAWFEKRAAHFARALGVQVPPIRLSSARTRWGSCHADGHVLLNWRLVQMPPALIDYVVVHELAHLREPNHSPRFWNRVAAVLPDYRERRQALRRDSHCYLLV